MSDKKYPFNSDFDDLAKVSLTVSSDLQLRLVNLMLRTQFRFRQPHANTTKARYTAQGYQGHRLTMTVITPDGSNGRLPCVYYSHGGGFLMDLLPAHMDICSEYAYKANCVVVISHYRVAVGNPFPVSVEDCYAGLKWTLDSADMLNIDQNRLVLAGESAGGGLTASLSQMVRDRGLVTPIFQMLIYPVTSSKLDSNSMVNMPDAPVWGATNARISWQKYLAGHSTPPKYASPLDTEDFSNLPPAYIEPSEYDVLRDEGIAYANKLEAAGVNVELNVSKGTIHAFDLNKESSITQAAMDSRVNALMNAFQQ